MKTLIFCTALFPAGLIAALWGGTLPQEEESTGDGAPQRVGVVRIHQEDGPGDIEERRLIVRGHQDGEPHALRFSSSTPLTADGTLAMLMLAENDDTRMAVEQLRKASNDDEKADARDTLTFALGKEFDEHLDHQAKELERMEAKLNKLRTQWEKRRDAKDKLVALRLQTLENDINGLGWPSGGPGGDWRGAAGVYSLDAMRGANLFTPPGPPTALTPTAPTTWSYSVEADVEEEPAAEPAKPRGKR